MSSESGASTSGDEASEPNPNPDHTPKPPEDQLAALALSEVDSHGNGVAHGSAAENNHQEIESDEEEVQANSVAPGLAEGEEASEGSPRGGVGGGVVWATTNSELEIDGPSSPSSSGYVGERGSSASSGGSGTDEISEVRKDEIVDRFPDSQTPWVPSKRHVDEDDASISWRKRKKHFFILSHSGKPIYSRYGDEHKLAGFSATLQAIISFVENG